MVSFSLFRFTLRPLEPLHLPRWNKGNVLRGAFGTMLRRMSCHPDCPGATRCELQHSCPYAVLFEPRPPVDARVLRNYEAIPRPFVFRPPLEETTVYEQLFEFGLVLAGKATEYLPHVVMSFAQLASEGFGLNRVRVTLDKVEQASGKLIYDGKSGVMHQPDSPSPNPHPPSPEVNRIAVHFLTPTHLVFQEQTVRKPEFHHLIRRIRDRVNALAVFYGDGPLDLDFAGVAGRAQTIRCLERDLRWEDRSRVSSKPSKRGQRHTLGGFTGVCVYEGDLTEFMPLLRLGELAHVGKHTAWGNGWFEIVIGPKLDPGLPLSKRH